MLIATGGDLKTHECSTNWPKFSSAAQQRAHLVSLETHVLQKVLLSILQEKRPCGDQPHKQHGQGDSGLPHSRLGERCSVVATTGLSLERRHNMVASAVAASAAEIANIKAELSRAKRLLKETLKSGDLQAAEVRRDALEFRRDVIVGAEDPLSGLTLGEALLRWLEMRIRKRDAQEEKLKAKLRAAKQSALKQAAAAKRPGSGANDLQYIDMHQLEIENEQFAGKVEASKTDVAIKKRKCASILQAQTVLKEQLARSLAEGANLAAGLTSRRAALERTKREAEQISKETDALLVLLVMLFVSKWFLRLLVQSRNSNHIPQVMDLVRQKAALLEKSRQLQSWRRKVEVVELEARTVREDLKIQASRRAAAGGISS
ncbi:hypothetical protein cyc_04418 [Cyclospora cayetanensis]|uniref:Cilia- and flagella-associated protein 263 n=1 Tax=Cyclospora cayetanensis TaxID=88456 RepID=A0A1D3CY90_9EIME|nr:hypothetical protein cyc_04418 [Cyclospora cayetanensis]